MTTEKAIEMIDEYLLEPNNIDKMWVEALGLCRDALVENIFQKTEIDILIRKKESLRDEIEEQQEEIERYKAQHKDFVKRLGNLHSLEIMVFDRANELKADAIKEFWERLKETRQWDVDIPEYVFTASGDNLVKELTEQSVNYGSSKITE